MPIQALDMKMLCHKGIGYKTLVPRLVTYSRRLDARTLARLRLVDRGRRRSVALHRGDLGSLNTLTLWFENTASLVFQVLDDLMVPSAREGAELVP